MYKKGLSKMLMKLTPGWEALLEIFFCMLHQAGAAFTNCIDISLLLSSRLIGIRFRPFKTHL